MATERSSPPDGLHNDRQLAAVASLVRVLLLASLAVVILFGAFELLMQTWLREASEPVRDLLLRVRGGTAALIAAGVGGWLIVREGPPLIAAGPLPAEEGGATGIDPDRKRLHYARWFILMRWIAVVVATIATVIAVDVARLLPARVGPSLMGLIATLMVLNLAYSVALRFTGTATAAFLALQVYADVCVLILLLHFSGGIENPLTPLLLLHVIIAGIVLGRVHSYAVAAVASLLFALFTWGEVTGLLPHYMLTIFPHVNVDGIVRHAAHDPVYAASRVALQTIVLFLVAYFTTTLVERIRADEQQLEAQAEQALTQAQTLERALDTTNTAICLCSRELVPFWANARWTEWVASAPALRCSACDAPANATLLDGSVRSDEVRSTPAPDDEAGSGRVRVFHVTTAPVRDRTGQVSQVVTLARDVTEEREAQARALRAERLAAAGELAGRVAHEVNNPIAILSAKARLLLANEDAGQLPLHTAQELNKIAELSDRVARIAQGLLSYCRPAPGLRSPLDIALPLRRALAFVETRARAAAVEIRDELPGRMPCVDGNAPELEQVFLNVLLNAFDAMPRGGLLRIEAEQGSTPAGAAAVVLRFRDTGVGVPAELRPRVFEPFLTTKSGGTGLGLSICQGIIRSHGGEIELEAEAEGACLTIRLPVHVSTHAAAADGSLPEPVRVAHA